MMFWRKRPKYVLSFRGAAFGMLTECFGRPLPSRLIVQLWVDRTRLLNDDEFIRAIAAVLDRCHVLDNPVAQVLLQAQILARENAVQPDTGRLGEMIGRFLEA